MSSDKLTIQGIRASSALKVGTQIRFFRFVEKCGGFFLIIIKIMCNFAAISKQTRQNLFLTFSVSLPQGNVTMMYKELIEIFLGPFWKAMLAEYQSMNQQEITALYNEFVHPKDREGLDRQSIPHFTSKECHPEGWKTSIRLDGFVDENIRVYLLPSPKLDLRPYVKELINDPDFHDLIMVAIHIMRTVKPRVNIATAD